MGNSDHSIHFGILIDSFELELWQLNTIKHLVDNNIKLSLVVKNEVEEHKQNIIRKIKNYPYRRMLFQVWNHYFFKPDCKQRISIQDQIKGIEIIGCQPIQKGHSTYFHHDDVEKIESYHLDFMLRFGFNIIRGEVLNAAKYGIWSFHHDDENYFRGGPPGFWEFMRDVPINGVILQQLTDSLDKGIVLKKVYYKTILHSYKAHLNQLYFESETLPLQVCRELLLKGTCEKAPSLSDAPIRHAPKNIMMLKYWYLCVYRRIRFHFHDIFCQEDWNVAFLNHPLDHFLDSPKKYAHHIHWFHKSRKSSYFADPFVISTENDTYIFFEWYQYKNGKGVIAVAKKSEGFKQYHVALKQDFHLSYPFVFEENDTIYCLPEANESGRLTLYRFEEEKLQLIEDCVLMENIRAIDPTLVHLDEKWYLFLTQKDFPSVKLYLYLSDSFKGPFEPFYNNPVKVNCADARPAGKIVSFKGMLIRPAQECIREYGTGVYLNEVKELSDSAFAEKRIRFVAPFEKTKYAKGLHTINGNETMTVFDCKRYVFTWAGMIHQIKLKLKH